MTVTLQPPGGIDRPLKVRRPVWPAVKLLPAAPPQVPAADWLALMAMPVNVSVNVAPVRVMELALLSENVMVDGVSEVMALGENALLMPAWDR